MKNKNIKWILLIFVIWFIIISQFFGYSSTVVSEEEKKAITDKYSLNLEDENWRCDYYTKNTFINFNPPYYSFVNFFVNLFQNQEDPFNTKVSVEVTEGDTIFNKAHKIMIPSNYRDRLAFTQTLQHNDLSIFIEMVKDTRAVDDNNKDIYSPECRMKFRYNDCLYQISFLNYPRITYIDGETSIHEDELKIYLDYLDEILIYE